MSFWLWWIVALVVYVMLVAFAIGFIWIATEEHDA